MGSLLLHSVSYAGLWGQAFLPVHDFIEKAGELGFDGVMLMAKRPHVSVLDYGHRECSALRTYLDKHKLREVCIAGYCNLTVYLEHADIRQRQIQVQSIVERGRMAHDVGGKLVRVFTGYEHHAADLSRQGRLVV